jgi:hypothetical protein
MDASNLCDFLIENRLGNTSLVSKLFAFPTKNVSNETFQTCSIDILENVCGDFKPDMLSGEKRLLTGSLRNPEYARRGFHVIRSWLASKAHEIRLNQFEEDGYDTTNVEKYTKEGLVFFEDYMKYFHHIFPHDEIQEEFRHFPIAVHKRPDNILINPLGDQAPRLKSILASMLYEVSLCMGISDKSKQYKQLEDFFFNNAFVQRVHNRPDDNDNQKNLHIDTFFPACKFWWFSQDVTADDGAFVYVRNSSKHTTAYYNWLYNQSIAICEDSYEKWRLKDHEEGSLRVSDIELAAMGLEAKPIEVKANTLVVGNVGGFHGRGHTKKDFTRNAVHGSIRFTEPFNVGTI